MIDKKKLNLDINFEDKNLPDFLSFLMIVDNQFPTNPPKILAKTNVVKIITKFCFPSLMDGRDLFPDIWLNKWYQNI